MHSIPMIRLRHVQIAISLVLVACSHQAPVSSPPESNRRIKLIETGTPPVAGTRFAIQFNDEPMIVHVADGRGGPPILYHGQQLNPDRLKSIIMLKTKEARERFGDQTLDAAILIELK
jgi:hypothetical protein